MYSSALTLTSALDGVGVQRHAGLAPGYSGRLRKNSPPPGFDLRFVQPVASRFPPNWFHRQVIA
jgi:hypothetical protein